MNPTIVKSRHVSIVNKDSMGSIGCFMEEWVVAERNWFDAIASRKQIQLNIYTDIHWTSTGNAYCWLQIPLENTPWSYVGSIWYWLNA